jgi:hypothetical protein
MGAGCGTISTRESISTYRKLTKLRRAVASGPFAVSSLSLSRFRLRETKSNPVSVAEAAATVA